MSENASKIDKFFDLLGNTKSQHFIAKGQDQNR
jgi:hypothetical protein